MFKLALGYTPFYLRQFGRTYRTGVYRYCKYLSQELTYQLEKPISFIHSQLPPLDQFDLFHSLFHVHLIPDWVKKDPHMKSVMTLHDLIAWIHPEFFTLKSKDFFHLKQMLCADAYMVPSLSTRQDLITYFSVDPNRIFVTPLAACPSLFSPNPNQEVLKKYGVPEAPYFIFLGRLEERKGIHYLLQAFKHLVKQEKLQDVHLVLGGPIVNSYPEIYHLFQYEVVQQGLSSQVHHIPFIEDEDLSAFYSNAIAHTFFTQYEGFGLPALEAMQCGTPTLCFDHSSLPEVIGDCGVLVKDRNLDSLSEEMLKLYTQDTFRASLSKKGLKRARSFTWQHTASKTIEAYQSILNLG